MDITQLKYFITLARRLNFSETARIHGVPQPSISRSIVDLEAKLGVPLFIRSRHSVTLTREGEAFLPFAVQITELAEKAAFAVEQVHLGCPGYLSIAALPTVSGILTRCLSKFSAQYPDVMVDITQNTGSEQNRALEERRFDFYFVQQSMLREGDEIESMVTHHDRLVLVVPKGHCLGGGLTDFGQIRQERLILLAEKQSPHIYREIMELFHRHATLPRVMQRYDKAETVILSVGAGLGITILPAGLVRTFPNPNVETVELPGDEMELTYVMAWPKELNNPSAKLFLEVAKSFFSEEGD